MVIREELAEWKQYQIKEANDLELERHKVQAA